MLLIANLQLKIHQGESDIGWEKWETQNTVGATTAPDSCAQS